MVKMAFTPLDSPYPCCTQTSRLYVWHTGVIADRILHCRNGNFWPFWLLWPWPCSDDLDIQTRLVVHGDTPHVQIWTSYVKAFQSYRLTDRHTGRHDQNYIPRHFTGGQKDSVLAQLAELIVNWLKVVWLSVWDVCMYMYMCAWINQGGKNHNQICSLL